MRQQNSERATTRTCLVVALAVCPLFMLIAVAIPQSAFAHEGHAALPSKGLTVLGNQLLLSKGAQAAIDLQTEKVVLADMQRVVKCNARVELPWQQQAMVTTQVPGRIGRVFVRPGDVVKAGQELANIESLDLEALQLAMLQADAELSLARDQLARQSSLAEQGVIAGKIALETQATVRQRTAELEITICKLRALGLPQSLLDEIRQTEKPVTKFSIVSPISGVVAEADVRTGEMVKTTEHLFHIVDLSTVWVFGEVLEAEVSQVEVEQPALIRFSSLPEKLFSGTIDHLHMKMDNKRRTRAVAVALDNSEGLLRPGMFGRMEIEVRRSPEAIVCPTVGIIRYFGDQYVLLNRGKGKFNRQQVQIGIHNDRQVEILDGLFPGDQIVVNGNHVLFSLFANETPPATVPLQEADESLLSKNTADSEMPDARTIVIQGTVELPTNRKAFASPRIEGRISRINVSHSQPIRAGEVLAEVESLQLRNLQGELLESHAKLTWTRERVRRLEAFAEKNVTAKKELWQLQTDQRVLASKVASTLRTLAMVGIPEEEVKQVLETDLSAADCDLTLLRSIPIRAAIDGAVADFDLVPGQIVNADDTLFEIHDTSKVWVKGYVFQNDASHARAGQEVDLTFHALPGVLVKGTIVRISPVMNKLEHVMPIWVEVDNLDGRLIEGMLARIEIASDRSSLSMK